jgi:hypothetical protein
MAFLAAMVLAAVAAEAPPSVHARPSLMREAIMALSDREVAVLVFGQAAALIAEFERPTHFGMFGAGAPMFQLRFATAPRPNGEGLCVATVITFSLEPNETFWEERKLTAEYLRDVSAEPAYKMIAPGKDCASAGRVLPQGSANFGQHRYFFTDGVDPHGFRQAFTAAVAASRSAEAPPVLCEQNARIRDKALCANPAGILQTLDPAALLSVRLAPCQDHHLGNCLRATFVRPDPDQERLSQQSRWRVTFPAELAQENGNWVAKVGQVRIDSVILAID